MSNVERIRGLKCRECGERYPVQPTHVCSFCFGPLEVEYDYDAIREVTSREKIAQGPVSLWRYKDLLPVEQGEDLNWRVGFTPLQRAHNLGKALGLKELYVKNDSVNPTFSFKDRVVSVAVAKAKEFGFDTFACASTGNLASATAAAGVRNGLRTFVFLPHTVEHGKVINAAVYGATLVSVEGTYDELNRLCSELADRYSWAFVNINIRPYYSEGSKSLAFEVVEQLGWRAPDHIVAPIASGSLYTKVYKGLGELYKVGLLEGTPHTRISGAQGEGCSPVAEAYAANTTAIRPVKIPTTIAHSLAIGNPADGYYAVKIAQDTGGAIESVTDEEVVSAIQLLASTEGVFTEPAGGVTIATLKKLVESGKIAPDEVTVAYVTGNGLKAQEAISDKLDLTIRVAPHVESFEAALSGLQPTPVAV